MSCWVRFFIWVYGFTNMGMSGHEDPTFRNTGDILFMSSNGMTFDGLFEVIITVICYILEP